MSVSRDEVRRIAALARLRLDEERAGILAEELNRILEHVDTLAEVRVETDLEGIRLPPEPVPFRPADLTPDSLPAGAPGAGAPRWEDGFFVVPRLPGVQAAEEEGS
jgi:aspartyl-tRNA(Asn)/glutamyl-tRNA(Gln) amidotransferase subunit C